MSAGTQTLQHAAVLQLARVCLSSFKPDRMTATLARPPDPSALCASCDVDVRGDGVFSGSGGPAERARQRTPPCDLTERSRGVT